MKKHIFLSIIFSSLFLLYSCEDYLEKAPDEDLTIEKVFSQEITAERFLASVYFNLPEELNYGNEWGANPFEAACDALDMPYTNLFSSWMNIGAWSPDNTPQDLWNRMYQGIRKANIFLENVDRVPMNENTKREWIGEATFLRAYFHFFLLRAYGPMNISRRALGPQDDFTELTERVPLDEYIEFILSECLKAENMLPMRIDPLKFDRYAGHATQAASMGLRARLLLYRASPFWNGNPDYADFKNKDGVNLFPTTYEKNRWQIAADSTKKIIDRLEAGGYALYYSTTKDPVDNYKKLFFEMHNKEVLFARNLAVFDVFERVTSPNGMGGWSGFCPTQEMIDEYEMADGSTPILGYETNGISPIINSLSGYKETGFAPEDHPEKYYLKDVRNMYVNREPRFYATINYQNCFWRTRRIDFKKGGLDGSKGGPDYTTTGYLLRKYSDEAVDILSGKFTNKQWIYSRLGELYLNYAEALNEAQGPVEDVYKFVNAIRERAGLPELKKGLSYEKMKERIHHERRIELAYENYRYFDCQRWKTLHIVNNKAIHGMNINASDDAFFERTKVEDRVFETPKHYLFPIHQNEINKAPTLYIQNPGWSGVKD